MASNSKGILTQAIENIKSAEAVIKAFKGLPKNAVSIQKNVGQVTDKLLPNITGMQTKVIAFSNSLQTLINKQIDQLDKGNTTTLPQFVKDVKAKIAPINNLIGQNLTKSHKASDAINQDSIALQKVSINLSAQIAGLASKLAGEKKEVDALNKKKLYLIGLGFLGAPGLIALAILLKKANDKVDSLKSQENSIKSQIRTQKSFLSQTKSFLKDFSQLINKLSGVLNSMDILLGDINNISTDIKQGKVSNPDQARLYLATSLIAVNTLSTDAS